MHTFSKFLRLREKDGLVAVFHELHPNPIYCSVADWQSFTTSMTAADPRLIQRLQDEKLLVVSSGEDDLDFIQSVQRLEKRLSQPVILYLMLAQGCNFVCDYCPIPKLAARHGEKLLSSEDARSGLQLWAEHLRDADDPKRETYIIFYGGEPLLNKQTFISALDDIQEMRTTGRVSQENLRLMLATNGTLFDKNIIQLCKKHNISVVVGLDGPRPSFNRYRVYSDERGSFDDVVSTIRKLVASGIHTAVSTTITPDNLEEIAPLAQFLKELGVEKFGLNFLKGGALSRIVPESERGHYESRVASILTHNLRLSKREGFEYQLEKKIEAYRRRDFFPVDCTCYGNQLVIQPDGQVSNCPFFKADLGHIGTMGSDFRIANAPIVAQWRKRLPMFHEAFRDVDAKSLCGPGCAWGSYDLSGDFLSVDMALTEFSKEVFDELIWSGWNPNS